MGSGFNANFTTSAVSPDWCPPVFSYKDADEIYVWPGRFFKGGYRFKGQYQDLAGLATYWDVASKLSVDIDGVYSAGVTSGMLGGKVNSSWYSLFMMGNTANDFLVLPFVRVKAIAYGAPSTTINPGDHPTGASYEDGFITAADQWNTYRLVKLDMEDPLTDGNVYTIADTTDGTHDGILITGDKTSEIAAGDWLQLIPPSGVDCVYLGSILINISGNITEFVKNGWVTSFRSQVGIMNLNKATTASLANSDLSTCAPPTANRIAFDYNITTAATARGIVSRVYAGSSGSTAVQTVRTSILGLTAVATWHIRSNCSLALTATNLIRNHAAYFDASSNETALEVGDTAQLQVFDYEE